MNALTPSLRTQLKETAMPVTVSPPAENPDAELLAAYSMFHSHNRLITDQNSPWWSKSSSDERSNEGNALWEKLRDHVLSFTPKTPLGFGVMALMAFHEALFLEDIPRDDYLKWDGYSVPSDECEDFHSPLTAFLWLIVAASGISACHNSDAQLLSDYLEFHCLNRAINDPDSAFWESAPDDPDDSAAWGEAGCEHLHTLRQKIHAHKAKTPLAFGITALMCFRESGFFDSRNDLFLQWDGCSIPDGASTGFAGLSSSMIGNLRKIVDDSGIIAYRGAFAGSPPTE